MVGCEFCKKKKLFTERTSKIKLWHTDCIVAKMSSSATENKALASMLATVSGCKLRIADTASLDMVESYNKAYHLCEISLRVNLQLNFTPLCTIDRLFDCEIKQKIMWYFKTFIFTYLLISKIYLTCNTLCISIKSSVGFQRPKSLFKFFCFLDLFLFDDDDDDDWTVEVDGTLAKGFNVLVELRGVLLVGNFRGWVEDVEGVKFGITISGTLWTGDMILSISVKIKHIY